jgi:hypothetical protein
MSLPGHPGRKSAPDCSASSWGAEAIGLWNPMTSQLQAWNGACGKAAVAINREWGEFLRRRMREDAALPQNLATCQGLDEAWHVCAEFWQKAVQDYQQEFTELARLNGEIIGDGMTSLDIGRTKNGTQQPPRTTRK